MKKVIPSDKLKSSLSELKNNENETWRTAKFDNDLNLQRNDIPIVTESNEEMLNNEFINASLEEKIRRIDQSENKKDNKQIEFEESIDKTPKKKSSLKRDFARSKTLAEEVRNENVNHPKFSIFSRQQNMSFNLNQSAKRLAQSSSLRIEGEDSYSDEESDLSSDYQDKLQWEKSYFLANVALHFENYKEGVKYIDEMILLCDDELNNEQIRVFLGINFGYINELRNTHKKILNLILTENKGKQLYFEIKDEKEQLILKRSERIIRIINEHILNKKVDKISLARMYKVKADFYRYMAEITTGTTLYHNKQNAFNFYNSAKDLVKDYDDLNPVKLNIALNYSIFLDEILNLRMNSYFYAKEALFNALKALKNCKEEELTSEGMRDTLMIIESLNTNVEDWYKEEVGDIFEQEKSKKNEEKKKSEEKKKKLIHDDENNNEQEFINLNEDLIDINDNDNDNNNNDNISNKNKSNAKSLISKKSSNKISQKFEYKNSASKSHFFNEDDIKKTND
jgi:14-3-3 protein epsilon